MEDDPERGAAAFAHRGLEFALKNGQIAPRLTGTLHVDDADGTCARMKLAYRDRGNDALTDPAYSAGTFLTKRADEEFCADDNGHPEAPAARRPPAHGLAPAFVRPAV